MPSLNKKLFLFTAEFPFGVKSETFLETEISFLAEAFKEVIILPGSIGDGTVRNLPSNVHVDRCLAEVNLSGKNKRNALIRNLGLVFGIIITDAGLRKIFSFIANSKGLLDYLAIQILIAEKLVERLKDEKNSLFYDYWFVDSTLALTILKKKGIINHLICRAHRFDLYDDQNTSYGVPFRNWKMRWIDQLFLISKHGLEYAKSKTPQRFHSKLILSRLGVKSVTDAPVHYKSNEYLVVSCSRMEDFKQVELIPIVLKHCSKNIKWIHFGTGPLNIQVEKNSKDLPSHIQVELAGQKTNTEVLQFYSENDVDLFLSLSLSEGLPVSMMEAQSYGVPIMAFPVGGVPELVVEDTTGTLLPIGLSVQKIARALENSLSKDYNRAEIKKFFHQNFEASHNYQEFTTIIGKL